MKARLRKSERFMFRLTAEQKLKLEKIADSEDKHPSELVRSLVLQKIKQAEAA